MFAYREKRFFASSQKQEQIEQNNGHFRQTLLN